MMNHTWLHALLACTILTATHSAIGSTTAPTTPSADPALADEAVGALGEEAIAQNPRLEVMRARTRELNELAQASSI